MAKKQDELNADIKKQMENTKVSILEQEKYKKWVEAKFKEVVDHFLIDFVSLTFRYPDGGAHTKDGHVIFTVNASDKYHQMNINVFPTSFTMWKNGQYKRLVEGIVHECAHIHTDRLTKLAENRYATNAEIHDACEDLTEVVAQYIRMLIAKEAPQLYNK